MVMIYTNGQWRNQGAANGQLPIEILLFENCLFIFELDSNCNVINRDIKKSLKYI